MTREELERYFDEILSLCMPIHPEHHIDKRNIKQGVMQLIDKYTAEKVLEGKIEELNALNTHRAYGKDYQESLDDLDVYKDVRLFALRAEMEQLKEGGNE